MWSLMNLFSRETENLFGLLLKNKSWIFFQRNAPLVKLAKVALSKNNNNFLRLDNKTGKYYLWI